MLTDDERRIARRLISYLPDLLRVDPHVLETKVEMTADGVPRIYPPEAPEVLFRFFDDVYRAFGDGEYFDSPVPGWLAQPEFVERAEFSQLRTVFEWMLRGEHWCIGLWPGLLQDGSLVRVLKRLSVMVADGN